MLRSLAITILPLSLLISAAPAPQYDASTTALDPTTSSYLVWSSSDVVTVTSSGVVSSSTLPVTSTAFVESSSVARSTPTSSAAAVVASGVPAVHLVQVGANGLTYTPNFVNAAIGDHVVFEFHAMNHTATQSSFESPCFHLTALDGITPIGLDSGFVPVAANTTVFPSWSLTVEVSTPLWFYCRQSNHCEQGMGFGINPPVTRNTIDAFIAKAKNVTSIPVWTETATAAWTGSGIAAQFSTGVSQVLAATGSAGSASAAASTAPASSGARSVAMRSGVAVLVVGVVFAMVL